MHIHKYEKLWLAASLVLIVLFIGTVTYGAVGMGFEMLEDEETIEWAGADDPSPILNHPEFSDPGVRENEDGSIDVYVTAAHPNFNPNDIEVPADREVTFHVAAMDVIHGFQITGTNVNTMVIPGEIAQISTEFDETGDYGIVCNEYCGPQHHEMGGQLTVVPEGDWDGGDN